MGHFQCAWLMPALTPPAQDSTLAPVLLALGTDDGTEAERWSPLACPRSCAGGPRVEEGRQSSDSGQPPLPASEVRDVAGPSQARSGGPRPEAPSLARPPRPPGAEALGRAGGGTSGGGASWLPGAVAGLATSPPGPELAGRAAAPGRSAGLGGAGRGARDPQAGQGRGRRLGRRKVSRSCLRARAGPAGWNMNVFRILGDLSHLLAMILLLGKIWRSKCCTGEGRAQRAGGTPERGGGGGAPLGLCWPASCPLPAGLEGDLLMVSSGWGLLLGGDRNSFCTAPLPKKT